MRTLLRGSLVVLVLVTAAWLVSAQAGPTVYPGQAFDLYMTHDGLRTNTYHLAITGPTGYQADLPVSSLANGRITFPVATGFVATGNYTAIITAIGDGGSTPSDPFAFAVVALPAPPSKGVIGFIKR